MELQKLLKDAVSNKVDNVYIYPPVKPKLFGLLRTAEPSEIFYRVNGKRRTVYYLRLDKYTVLKNAIKKEVGLGLIDEGMEDNKIYHFKDGDKNYPVKVASKPIGKDGSVITISFNVAI